MRFIIGLFFLIPIDFFSQNNELLFLSGNVKEIASNLPIQNVGITLLKQQDTVEVTFTDSIGNFLFKNLQSGNYNIVFYHHDYLKKNKLILLEKTNQNLNVYLKLFSFNLNTVEIISSAQNNPRMVGSSTKLDKKKIKQISPVGTQEILTFVPGVNGFSDDGIGQSRISIGIRGINPRRTSRTLVLEDGIPIQPALYVYSNMYYNPPVERIEEIEIVKGGSSIEFGPQTMGGVINYKTKLPSDSLSGKLSLTGGSNAYISSLIELGGFGNKIIKPEFQLIYKKGDGFRQNNDFTQYNGTLKLLIRPNKKRRIYINLNANN